MTNEKHAVDRTREELKQKIHAYKDEPSFLFTATFMERSPMTNQFPDATKMVLSPAAQAVLDAGRQYATQAWSDATHQRFNLGIAAALRAAANQVVPPFIARPSTRTGLVKLNIRNRLLHIADELDGDE